MTNRRGARRFQRNVARGRSFERKERQGWQGKNARFEVSTISPEGRRGRIDVRIDEIEGVPGGVVISENKATDWDRLREDRVRPTALRHARQIWRYIETELDLRRDVVPALVYPRAPRKSGRREKIEQILHAQLIQVVWRND